MLKKVTITVVMCAVIASTFTTGIISAALALLAFSLLVYYSTHKSSN